MSSARTKIPVTVITTVFNEAKTVRPFMESIFAQQILPAEVIIVDGGSTDFTTKYIEEFRSAAFVLGVSLRLIIDPECSRQYSSGPIAKGRNLAISCAENEIIAATDAGCILDEYWLQQITEPLLNRKAEAVAGSYAVRAVGEFQEIFTRVALPKPELMEPRQILPSSRSIAFTKAAWELAGKYPEMTLTAEDTLFAKRLKVVANGFAYATTALVYWDAPHCLSEALWKQFRYGKGDGSHFMDLAKIPLRISSIILPLGHLWRSRSWEEFKLRYFLSLSNCAGQIVGIISSLIRILQIRVLKLLVCRETPPEGRPKNQIPTNIVASMESDPTAAPTAPN